MSTLESFHACLDCSFGNDQFIIVVAVIVTGERSFGDSQIIALHDCPGADGTAAGL